MFLQLDRVSITYGRAGSAKPAVDAATLSLSRGQIGVLIGPSGCGKTSLLRAVAGLERVSGRSVRLGGELLSGDGAAHVAPEDRGIGTMSACTARLPM